MSTGHDPLRETVVAALISGLTDEGVDEVTRALLPELARREKQIEKVIAFATQVARREGPVLLADITRIVHILTGRED